MVAPRTAIQKTSIDRALRNRLWNIIRFYYLTDKLLRKGSAHSYLVTYKQIWCNFFENTDDTLPEWSGDFDTALRNWYFEASWNEVYDLLTFLIRECNERRVRSSAVDRINAALERHLSAYRWVNDAFITVVD